MKNEKRDMEETPTLPLHLQVINAWGVKCPCSKYWRWACSTFPQLRKFVVGLLVMVRRGVVGLTCRHWARLVIVGGPTCRSALCVVVDCESTYRRSALCVIVEPSSRRTPASTPGVDSRPGSRGRSVALSPLQSFDTPCPVSL